MAYALYQHCWPKGTLRRYGADLPHAEFQPLSDSTLRSRACGTIDGVIEA